MGSNRQDHAHDWGRDTQKIAVLSWISFLTAAVFSVVLFAYVDPLTIVDSVNVGLADSRSAGYAIGFFFLWAEAWIACWLTVRLIRRKRRGPSSPGSGSRDR